jgi:hypothetical protein
MIDCDKGTIVHILVGVFVHVNTLKNILLHVLVLENVCTLVLEHSEYSRTVKIIKTVASC